ncbi:MAG: hypothetical protein AB1Z23_06115 [Eubacteriales bacterium]
MKFSLYPRKLKTLLIISTVSSALVVLAVTFLLPENLPDNKMSHIFEQYRYPIVLLYFIFELVFFYIAGLIGGSCEFSESGVNYKKGIVRVYAPWDAIKDIYISSQNAHYMKIVLKSDFKSTVKELSIALSEDAIYEIEKYFDFKK